MRLQPSRLIKLGIATLSLGSGLFSTAASAATDHAHAHHDRNGEQQQLGVHVHGHARLNIALEDQKLHLELDSPANNIVGFEYQPSSAKDRAAVAAAVAVLQDGERLFDFGQESGCRMESAKIESALIGNGRHGTATDGRAHSHDDAHKSSDNAHANFRVEYLFHCARPDEITQVTVKVFEPFPQTERLDVQFIAATAQGAATLTSINPTIKF